ncbi:lysosomal alpha-glucosidase-like [Amblyomma americanum]
MRGEPTRHLFYRGGGFAKASRTSGTYPADHPFLILVSPGNGSACGVYLHNGNRIELMTSPPGAATFRTNGGQLDFYVFTGPTPKAVVEQYHKLVGRPSLPSINTLLHSMRPGGPVPLTKLVTNVQFAHAVHRLALFKHALNTTIAITSKVVIQDSTGEQPYTCYDDKDRAVYFIDFTHPQARRHWDETLFLSNLSVVTSDTLDYLLLEEPRCLHLGSVTPECAKEPLGGATYGAICGAARLHLSTYANLSNAYPYLLAEMTHRYRAKETFLRQRLLSDATFSGQGAWSGYWRARAPAYWVQLKDTLAEMLTFGMLGVNLYGASACNLATVRDERDAELCLRWYSLSVFFPVHQGLGKPTSAIQQRVANQASRATALRRFLLPYAYTAMVKASQGGGMLARPTYFEFPGDPYTHQYPSQFMFGLDLLVAPQLDKGAHLVEVYFPSGRWYDWYNSHRIDSTGQAMFVPSPNATAAMFTRGGTIIPGRALNRSTSSIHIIVSPDSSDYAYGELISDDGVMTGTFVSGSYSLIHFSYMKGILTGHCSVCKWAATLRAATVFGITGPAPSRVLLNDRPLKFAFAHKTLYIFDIGHKLRKPFAITLARHG